MVELLSWFYWPDCFSWLGWLYSVAKINEIIKGFIATLRQETPIKEVILFGSYANGEPKEYSGIDLLVISYWFEDRPKIENMQYLSRIAATYKNYNDLGRHLKKKYGEKFSICHLIDVDAGNPPFGLGTMFTSDQGGLSCQTLPSDTGLS